MNSKDPIKKKPFYKQLLCFVAVVIYSVLFSFSTQAQITTSLPILTLITKEVVGSTYTIETLITASEAAHHYELTPKTILMLSKQDLIIFNGLNLEHNLVALKNKAQFADKIIDATQGITPRINKNGKPDPHAWHDPDKLLQYIDTISTALEKKYPFQKTQFQTQTANLKEKITKWKKEKMNLIHSIKKPFLMVTPHDGFQYLAHAFGFNNISLMEDHHGESLSPKELILKIKELTSYPHRSFFGDGGSKDNEFKKLSQKTQSTWGGALWGEAPPTEVKHLSLMGYLDHNFTVLWQAYQKNSNTLTTPQKSSPN